MINPRYTLIATLLLSTAVAIHAQEEESDRPADLMELQVLASPREQGAMRSQPASVSLIGQQQLEDSHAGSLKQVSLPNFFMPDYGSRLSSAVYIRGIGSRINSPAIGLYVDDVPVLDKSAFDFGLFDLQRVDVLRGPQSTLYGAGTMGGVMRVYTRSPFDYKGTDIGLGYATGDNTRRFTLMHYAHPSERFAWSFGGYYDGGDGFFVNHAKGIKQDFHSDGGIRFRAMLLTQRKWMLDMALNYEISNEGAYPYYYMGRRDGKEEDKAEQLHRINSLITGLYERSVLRTSLNASRSFPRVEMRSITSFQTLSDSMQMDQDLLQDDIYKLTQVQKNNTLTEDLLLKSRKPGRWQWITGATASFLRSRIKGPVTFRQDGIGMLNEMICQQANASMPPVQNGPTLMEFGFDDQIQGKELLFDNKFSTGSYSAGIFHQSTFHDLFGLKGLSATLGLRLNADFQQLRYAAWYDFSHQYRLNGHLTMPGGVERDILLAGQDFQVKNGLYSSDYDDSTAGIVAQEPVKDHHLQLMPRLALQYQMERGGNLYATVSRGYRQGGYNVQNISELMRSLMMHDMMVGVRDATLPVLQEQPAVPQEAKDKIASTLNRLAGTGELDVQQACTYLPEYAWNYEVGAHLNLLDGKMGLDVSAFMSDIQDLQLSQMSETGLGRIMVNAGKSRSAGLEMMFKAQPIERLLIQANYGYTHATFREYSDYDAASHSLVDCKDNYVPFMPQHTASMDASYTVPLNAHRTPYTFRRDSFIPIGLTFGINYNGAGRIYWTEQNDAWQNYYSTVGARVTLDMKPLTISLWGSNLGNSHHNTFWFVSAGRAYEQHARPLQVGLDARFAF